MVSLSAENMLPLKRNNKTIIKVSVFWDSKRRIMIKIDALANNIRL